LRAASAAKIIPCYAVIPQIEEASMRALAALALLLLAAAPPSAARAESPLRIDPVQLTAADRAEIDGILRRWEKAWEDGDAVAWSNLFHEDGTWVLWTGGEWRGRAQIARDFAGPFATVYKDSVQRIRLVELRPLAPGVAVARLLGTTTGDSRQPGVTIYGNKILVLTKRDGRWGILYGQNTRLNDAEAAKRK
jgi:uncharacterized protein (TIGR02246 family)